MDSNIMQLRMLPEPRLLKNHALRRIEPRRQIVNQDLQRVSAIPEVSRNR